MSGREGLLQAAAGLSARTGDTLFKVAVAEQTVLYHLHQVAIVL